MTRPAAARGAQPTTAGAGRLGSGGGSVVSNLSGVVRGLFFSAAQLAPTGISARHVVLDPLNFRFTQQEQPPSMLRVNFAGLDELAQALRCIADFFGCDRKQNQPIPLGHAMSLLGIRGIVPYKTWRDTNKWGRIWRQNNFRGIP